MARTYTTYTNARTKHKTRSPRNSLRRFKVFLETAVPYEYICAHLICPLLKVDVMRVEVVADVTALSSPGAKGVQLVLKRDSKQITCHTRGEHTHD